MQTTEKVPCSCGAGALEVEVLDFGVWRIQKVAACSSCGSKDLAPAPGARSVSSNELSAPTRHRRAQAARLRLRR